MRRILGSVGVLLAALTLALVGPAGVAHADSASTVLGRYVATLSHKTASITFESWVQAYKNDNGAIMGAVGRTRLTDKAGVKSWSINAQALRWGNNATIDRDGTKYWSPASAGSIMLHDTNDFRSDQHYWAAVTNAGSNSNYVMRDDVSITIHWGDDVVVTYSLSSLDTGFFSCYSGTQGDCDIYYLPIAI